MRRNLRVRKCAVKQPQQRQQLLLAVERETNAKSQSSLVCVQRASLFDVVVNIVGKPAKCDHLLLFPSFFFNKKSNKISLFSNWHLTFGALSLLLFVNIYFSLRYCWFALPLSYDNSLCLATGASIFIDQRSFGASFYVLAPLSLSILLLSGNVGAFLRCFCAL